MRCKAGFFSGYSPNASLLLHFDGDDNGTVFVDSSKNALTVTAQGDAVTSTDQSKFGGASLYLPVGGDHLTVEASEGFNFGTGDFTIEFWWWPLAESVGGVAAYTTTATEQGWGVWVRFYDDQWQMLFDMPGFNTVIRTVTVTDEAWHHFAFSRRDGLLRFFMNGTQAGSAESVPTSVTGGSDPILVGFETEAGISGYLDEFRIVKGSAVYTANFTPPTAAYT